VLNYIYKFIRF